MRLRIIAVGNRMPEWVRAATDEYLQRLRPRLRVDLLEIAPARRSAATSPEKALHEEGARILAALGRDAQAVALDERGKTFSTAEFSRWLAVRLQTGTDLAFVIGGADGLAPEVLSRTATQCSLSRMTLPHALARVVLAEQLYRAMSVLQGHPYHRAASSAERLRAGR